MTPSQRRSGIDPVQRSRARRRALQAIYAWQVSGGDANGGSFPGMQPPTTSRSPRPRTA